MGVPNKGYEFFDHTADVGVMAQGATLEELFVHMAQGLVEVIAEDSVLKPQQTRFMQLSADSAESLLLRWMQAMHLWFSTDRFLPVSYALDEVTETSLRGTVRGDTFDPARHVQGREVKAITRHQLRVWQQDGLWRGQVIVDI